MTDKDLLNLVKISNHLKFLYPLAVSLLPTQAFAASTLQAEESSSPWFAFTVFAVFVIATAAIAITLCLLQQRKSTPPASESLNSNHAIAQALEASEDRFRTLVETINVVIWEIDPLGHYTYISPQVDSLLGYKPDELLQLNFPTFSKHPSMAVHINDAALFSALISKQTPFTSMESWQFDKKGNSVIFEISGAPILSKTNQFMGYRGVARDITARKRTEEELQHEKERFQVTLESIADGVVRTNTHGLVEYINPEAARLIGIDSHSNLGKHIDEFFNVFDEANGQHIRDMVKRAIVENSNIHFVSTLLLHHGLANASLNIEIRISPIYNNKGGNIGTVIVFHDISEIKRLTGQMAHQSSHDILTEVFNRPEFERRLETAIKSAQTGLTTHVLCHLDLDEFNVINETYGHIAGDELLKQLAHTLVDAIRETDVLARIGGDEFGILLIDCNTSRASEIADSLCQKVRDLRCEWQNQVMQVGVSGGLVRLDKDSGTLADVFSAADSACFVAKELGRNQIHVFHPNDTAMAKRHGMMQWMHQIKAALNENRFSLFCEGFIPLSNNAYKVKHYETLVRMTDSSGNEIPPMSFIPAAERYHLMPEIDRWVIKNTLATIALALPQQSNIIYTINLSGQSLSDQDFFSFISDEFHSSGVSPKNICFEITETAAISHLNNALKLINALRNMGCTFALDDFGTGLSSFNYLRSLPVQYLKIDGSFVRQIQNDPIDYAMVNTINQIGHIMGLITIAEYVENPEILARVKEIGIDYAQGHYIADTDPLMKIVFENKSSNNN